LTDCKLFIKKTKLYGPRNYYQGDFLKGIKEFVRIAGKIEARKMLIKTYKETGSIRKIAKICMLWRSGHRTKYPK